MIHFNILLLTMIVIYVVDISGIVGSIKSGLSRWLKVSVRRLKPFDCSLCMVWWCGLIYLLLEREVSLANVTYVAMLSIISVQIGGVINLLRDALQALIDFFYRKIDQ